MSSSNAKGNSSSLGNDALKLGSLIAFRDGLVGESCACGSNANDSSISGMLKPWSNGIRGLEWMRAWWWNETEKGVRGGGEEDGGGEDGGEWVLNAEERDIGGDGGASERKRDVLRCRDGRGSGREGKDMVVG